MNVREKMNLHEWLYNCLVRKNKDVQEEYEQYVIEHIDEHAVNRFKHWKVLIGIIWRYRVRKEKRKSTDMEMNSTVQEIKKEVGKKEKVIQIKEKSKKKIRR